MSPGVGEIDYDRSAELICRASYPEVEPDRLQVELHLIDRTSQEEAEDQANPPQRAEKLPQTEEPLRDWEKLWKKRARPKWRPD